MDEGCSVANIVKNCEIFVLEKALNTGTVYQIFEKEIATLKYVRIV